MPGCKCLLKAEKMLKCPGMQLLQYIEELPVFRHFEEDKDLQCYETWGEPGERKDTSKLKQAMKCYFTAQHC